jgi:hypothetical protein
VSFVRVSLWKTSIALSSTGPTLAYFGAWLLLVVLLSLRAGGRHMLQHLGDRHLVDGKTGGSRYYTTSINDRRIRLDFTRAAFHDVFVTRASSMP